MSKADLLKLLEQLDDEADVVVWSDDEFKPVPAKARLSEFRGIKRLVIDRQSWAERGGDVA